MKLKRIRPSAGGVLALVAARSARRARSEAAARRARASSMLLAELGVTPTAISHQIRQLEAGLGVALFARQTRKVALTAEGSALYPALRRALDAMAEAVAAVRRQAGRQAATLSATVAFTAKLLVPRVASFRQLHPGLGPPPARLRRAGRPRGRRGRCGDPLWPRPLSRPRRAAAADRRLRAGLQPPCRPARAGGPRRRDADPLRVGGSGDQGQRAELARLGRARRHRLARRGGRHHVQRRGQRDRRHDRRPGRGAAEHWPWLPGNSLPAR